MVSTSKRAVGASGHGLSRTATLWLSRQLNVRDATGSPFTSTTIETTGPFTGRVTGNLSLAGVTKPVTLDVTYNGAMASAALYAGRPALGFSARGTLPRSAYGLTRYADFVGDEVEFIIEAEFTRH